MTDPADSDLVLLGEGGNPLIVDSINAKGNPIRIDTVRLAFNRVKAKLGIVDDSRGFAIFRKTSAENIAKANQDSPHLVDLFLGHTQRTMAKHYAGQHFDLLHRATDALRGRVRPKLRILRREQSSAGLQSLKLCHGDSPPAVPVPL